MNCGGSVTSSGDGAVDGGDLIVRGDASEALGKVTRHALVQLRGGGSSATGECWFLRGSAQMAAEIAEPMDPPRPVYKERLAMAEAISA